MNRYTAIGNLTQDPVCKDVGQSKVCTFGIAINEYFYKNQEKQKTTLFLDVETWSKQAENCVKFLEKGKKVAIEGKLKMNSWEKNGQKFNKVFCVADKVHFLGSEDQASSQTKKVSKEIKEQEIVENEEEEIEDIDDIPF
jgi:single-strand DNA-binding protein